MTDEVLVHADGGKCHGMAIVANRCSGCGIAPDTQSTELWPAAQVVPADRYRQKEGR